MTDQNTGEEETLSFNLVRDPWIPVLMRSGDTETLSLTQVFQRAPEISQVVGDLPTTTAAIEGVLQSSCLLSYLSPHALSEAPSRSM